jgi:quinol-cytochrome oxidoreductase complex cytochrome b subunit/mono/diheme cytochrome c family protein
LLKTIAEWLDDRTGLPSLVHRVLERPIPGGARWGHSLGFALASTIVVALFTGLLLMITYSPSSTMAWGSVYFITYQMDLGWFVRGLHRYASFGSVVLGGLFLLRLVLVGAYRAPREVHWWLAVGAFLLILGAGVSGNILPWDQRAYGAAVVELNIAGSTPVVGPLIKKVVVGGSTFGNQTITRIYAAHVAVLPGLLILCGWAYAVLIGKHGYHGPADSETTEPYWPRQAFFDFAFSVAVLGVLSALTVINHGYSLDAPADPANEDYPARPEWYFLPLNLLLHVFEGQEFIATQIIPGGIVAGLFLLPLIDKILPKRRSDAAASSFMVTLTVLASVLIGVAFYRDSVSDSFHEARAKADVAANRAIELATRDGILPGGSSYLLGLDPLYRGGEVFGKKCLGCHALGDRKPPGEPSAPDLKGYGSQAWIRGLLEKPDSPGYFGKTPQCDGMKTWKEESKLSKQELDAVAAFVVSFATIPEDLTPANWLADPQVKEHPGFEPYQRECKECHTLGDLAKGKMQPAPDLFAWGSDRWMARMIKAPGSKTHYGFLESDNAQKMPAFGGKLTESDVEMLVRYIKGKYEQPTGKADSSAKSP